MDNFNSKLIKSLINGDNVNKLLNKWLEGALNELLNNELSCFLHYNPYERYSLEIIEMDTTAVYSKRSLEFYILGFPEIEIANLLSTLFRLAVITAMI